MAGTRIFLTLLILAASALGLDTAGTRTTPPAPSFSLPDSQLLVEAGKPDGQAMMVLQAANIGEGVTATLEAPTNLGQLSRRRPGSNSPRRISRVMRPRGAGCLPRR